MTKTYSRRAVLAQITGGSAAAMAGMAPARHAFAQLDSEPWYFLTDTEARWIAGIVDVFIPEDEFPSASQAGVVDYIDLQMATGYGNGEGLYLQGPFPEGTPEQGYQLPLTPSELLRAGLEGLAAESEAEIWTLGPQERARFVEALSERQGTLGDVSAQVFFNELLSLANQGYFADPLYLGNHDYAGWKMVGFPGAHAYFTERVGDNAPTSQPPMGIAHGSYPARPPRAVGEG